VRLLLDEMLSLALARELRERGHDVLAVADHPGWVALSDPEVTALARTERRAVVANNLRDYRPLHADAITPGAPGHFGMIFMPITCRRTKEDTGRIIAALESKLAEFPGDEDLANASGMRYRG
jgi:predicted nuclease of predicted toxin-antitoxin system